MEQFNREVIQLTFGDVDLHKQAHSSGCFPDTGFKDPLNSTIPLSEHYNKIHHIKLR